MIRRAWAEIDLKALQNNLALAKSLLPDTKTVAVIKADGYGHGINQCAWALDEADCFGVAHISEAMRLRGAGIKKPILLMEGVLDEEEMELAARKEFWIAVGNVHQAKLVSICKPNKPLNIWLKVNTGMNRLGVTTAQAKEIYQNLNILDTVADVVVMTHFACADDYASQFTVEQINQFNNLMKEIFADVSVANSAAICAWGKHLQFGRPQWIRPGIMLYGSDPLINDYDDDINSPAVDKAVSKSLQPVMSLFARLIEKKTVQAGESVGYGATWTAEKSTTIGVVSIGYGDGYPRHAKDGTPVLINGQRVPLVGRVSMDMITVDLSSQPGAKIGDTATLWGRGLSVDEVAHWSDTISYELLCKVTPRVHREYLK